MLYDQGDVSFQNSAHFIVTRLYVILLIPFKKGISWFDLAKRTNAEQHCVRLSPAKFNQNRAVNVQSTVMYLFAPLRKV